MSIKVSTIEKVTSYEVNDVAFYECFGSQIAVTGDFILRFSPDRIFSILVPRGDEKHYSEIIADCLKYGKVSTLENFEKATAAFTENTQNKIAFIKEALALEGLGALAD